MVFAQTAGFYAVAGQTPADRAAFAAQMATVAAQFTALFVPPLRPDTVGGYVEFRGFHLLEILFAVWALASVTGFVRRDEERGVVDASLAAGVPRPVLIASRAGAFAVSAAVASGLAGLGFVLGTATRHDAVAAAGVLGEAANLAALAIACFALALVVAQLTGPRVAAAAAASLLLALFLVNSLSRVFDWLSTWRWVSPFRYYELSRPLPPGGTFDWRAFAVLLGFGLIGVGVAAALFARRDIGAALVPVPRRVTPASYEAAAGPWRIPVVRELWGQRAGLAAWIAGMAVLAGVFVALTRTIVDVVLRIPTMLPYLSLYVHQQLYPAVLGYTWLTFAELLLAGYALAQVARWAAEDGRGRLAAVLSQPYSRSAVIVERMAGLALAVLVIAAVTGAVLYYGSHAAGIDLDARRLATASVMLVPFALVFGGAGALLAAWNPRLAVAGLGAFAVASYLDTELALVYRLPDWVQSLSAFHLFGTPLLFGADARSVTLLVCLALAGLGGSILAIEHRDVGA